MERLCKHCGFKRGEHKSKTLNCPIVGGNFSQFHKSQVFEAQPVLVRRRIKVEKTN